MDETKLESTLSRVHDWIQNAEQKVSILFAVQGIVIALVAVPTYEAISLSLSRMSSLEWTIFILMLVVLLYSFYASIACLTPHLSKKGYGSSVIYFGDIARTDLSNFKKRMGEVTDTEYKNDLTDQIHVSSKIALKKHSLFRLGIITFIIGMVLLSLLRLLLGGQNVNSN